MADRTAAPPDAARLVPMGLDLARLLDIRFYQAFDLDEAGRVLAGSDESGSTQLVEIQPDGTVVALTALPGPCTGRYVPGERAVLVSHDDGGNELHQLSVLRLATPPDPPGQPRRAGAAGSRSALYARPRGRAERAALLPDQPTERGGVRPHHPSARRLVRADSGPRRRHVRCGRDLARRPLARPDRAVASHRERGARRPGRSDRAARRGTPRRRHSRQCSGDQCRAGLEAG